LENNKIKLSIGFPIYNSEKFLRNRLNSILSQSFRDFELIISDNASSDKTQKICQEFSEEDPRIKYTRQDENIGAENNFKFVLKNAHGKYFVWAAADDIWETEFLKVNIEFLESHNEVVGSISKVSRFGGDSKEFDEDIKDSIITKYYKKFRLRFRKFGVWTTKGSFEKKVRLYLRSSSAQAIYSVFRRIELEKSFCNQGLSGWDMAVILNLLRYGDINVINKELIHFGWGGTSRKDIQNAHDIISKKGMLTYFFPQLDFAKWCLKNLGIKIFITNLDYFIFINLWSILVSIRGILR